MRGRSDLAWRRARSRLLLVARRRIRERPRRRPRPPPCSRLASFFAARSAFCSATFVFASAYEPSTSVRPPVHPNAHTTSTVPKTTLNAVTISCWPVEYAAAFAGVGHLAQRGGVDRLVDADAARGGRDGVRERVAARHGHHRVEGDGDRVRREEDGDHAELREPTRRTTAARRGRGTRAGARGWPRPPSPSPRGPWSFRQNTRKTITRSATRRR